MFRDKFFKMSVVIFIMLGLAAVSCKKDNPVAPNPTYTITYNGNGNTGGTVPADNNKYEQGAAVTVKANTGALVRTGFTFDGWNTLADGSGSSYAASGSATFVMGSAAVTLYGKWTPAGIDFHITKPKTGDTLAWGAPVTFRWTLPADGSIDTVVVYRKPQDQQFYEALNLYFPVVAPADSYDYFIGSDVDSGMSEKFRIQNKVDSTQFDEITIIIKG
jgi:uncharacterized repeat protein (TIGR02543 family)